MIAARKPDPAVAAWLSTNTKPRTVNSWIARPAVLYSSTIAVFSDNDPIR